MPATLDPLEQPLRRLLRGRNGKESPENVAISRFYTARPIAEARHGSVYESGRPRGKQSFIIIKSGAAEPSSQVGQVMGCDRCARRK
jgi:hypothetical protein